MITVFVNFLLVHKIASLEIVMVAVIFMNVMVVPNSILKDKLVISKVAVLREFVIIAIVFR
jgi:hypothetical protein